MDLLHIIHIIVAIIAPSTATSVSPTSNTPISAGPSNSYTQLRPHTPPRPPIPTEAPATDSSLSPEDQKTSSQHFLFPRKTSVQEIELIKKGPEKKSKTTDRRNACTILKVPKPESISKDGLVYGMFHHHTICIDIDPFKDD